MAETIKTKVSFGMATIDHFSPDERQDWPKTMNIILSFEEALKLHLGLGQALGKLNSYNRRTTAGRESAINLCVFNRDVPCITIREDKIRT